MHVAAAGADNGNIADGSSKPGRPLSTRTLLVQGSEGLVDDPFHASMPPIYQTATFQQPGAVEMGEYDYSRSGNPTRTVLEKQMALLEVGGRGRCCCCSCPTSSAAQHANVLHLSPSRP
jgi:cystathionine beta-lyase